MQVVVSSGLVVPWAEVEVDVSSVQRADEATKADNENAADGCLQGFDERLMSLRVVPNAGEEDHQHFPHNLYHALELYLHHGLVEPGKRLQQCTNRFFQLLEEGPSERNKLGKARLCFECGHCGLADSVDESVKSGEKAGACTTCGDDSHTNLVELILPNGRQMPWMERDASAAAAENKPVAKLGTAGRVKPNDECPCGSGKKAKKCCHIGGV